MSKPNCKHCNDTKRIPLFMPGSFAPCDWCMTPAPAASVEADEGEEDTFRMVIDDHQYAVANWTNFGDDGYMVTMECGHEFVVFEDADDAGKAARAYWADMAANDPSEFRCMVGEESLIAWALGQYAGPGSTQVSSLSEWLDLHLDAPEEHFASYDSQERGVDDVSADIAEDLGFTPTVAYRHN